jgi:hypothetical protein
MPPALTLLLCASVAAADPAPPAEALDFRTGSMAGWEGEGFYVTTGTGRGPSLEFGVCSSDRDKRGRKGFLHRTFVVPPAGGVLYCRASAHMGRDCTLQDNDLDVVLLAAGKRVIPKRVRTLSGWQTVGRLQRPDHGKPREYVWHLDNYRGQTLRIALVDDDPRPGCHLWCAGFRVIPSDVFEPREFGRFMLHLTREQKLPPAARFDSEHFVALSTATDDLTTLELKSCELIYDCFYDHFRGKGFVLHRPSTKLMVAMFDSPAGFEAYVGQRMPDGIVGLYHPATNRLVVYDLGLNRAFVDSRRRAEEQAGHIGSDLERMREKERLKLRAGEVRTCANIATIMHEVAHQLSFNSGMLDRDADVPAWLAEGLACYCESTDNGAWQGIGEPNPERLAALAAAGGHYIPIRDLISTDEWLRRDFGTALLGYAESWALFRLLMEEHPHALRAYCALVSSRRAGQPRFQDFSLCFPDFSRLEVRYYAYLNELVEEHRQRGHRPTVGR